MSANLWEKKYTAFHENKMSEQYAIAGAAPYTKYAFRTHSLPQYSKLNNGSKC
jgi:hypothetical protein